jgi:hypothetical protein
MAPVTPQAGAGPVSPGGHAGQQTAAEDSIAQTTVIKLGLLEVSRSNPAERWLIRAMMTVEPDLAGLVDQPMVFAVYGRARILEPYVGKGITVDNLAQLVEFVTGACSCQVKDANPGVDLLTTWNWDATAEQLVAKDSPLDHAAGGYAEVETKTPSASTAGQAGSGAYAPTVLADQVASASHIRADTARLSHVPTALAEQLASASRIRADTARLSHEPTSFASRLAWRLGLGLLLGAAVVLAAGLVLVRHRGPV